MIGFGPRALTATEMLSAQAPQESRIMCGLDELARMIDKGGHEAVDVLERRIGPVLLPEMAPMPPPVAEGTGDARSPAVDKIERAARAAACLISRIEALAARLDI